ncbi:helix-turn-helix domain-containing protein [Lactobacillus delbrueckii]|uniref:helix-turn-helix domain-containing protein n=1 Tax=Lactobacillus delbrueckii TaxID=1584 RepID=UPI001E5A9B82|nr:helix-turn-helix transcriptional regulator [Lactobacillus delbrueckii]
MANGKVMKNAGKQIRSLRIANHMTQADLAEKLGVSYQAVGAYERGERGLGKKTLDKFTDIFGVSVEQILCRDDDIVIGNRLRELRKGLGLTLNEAAQAMTERFPDETKIVGNALGKYENGFRKPSYRTLRMLASFYGVSVEYLLGASPEENVIGILMDCYNVEPKVKPSEDGLFAVNVTPSPWLKALIRRTDAYLAKHQKQNLVKENKRNLDFWKETFKWLNADYSYLTECYGKVSKQTLALMISAAIASKNEEEANHD